jgi:hypothetical protein
MSLEFFENTIGRTGPGRSCFHPKVDIDLTEEARKTLMKDLGCTEEELQARLNGLFAEMLGAGAAPTEKDFDTIRSRAAAEQEKAMARIRAKAGDK